MQDFKVGDKVEFNGLIGVVVGSLKDCQDSKLVRFNEPFSGCHNASRSVVVDDDGLSISFEKELYYFCTSTCMKNLGSTL